MLNLWDEIDRKSTVDQRNKVNTGRVAFPKGEMGYPALLFRGAARPNRKGRAIMANNINVAPDLGAPLLVTAVDLIIESTAPDWSKWATGIMALGGYAGAYLGYGGDFVKNVGIAALPACAKNVYDWARAGTPVTKARKFTPRSVSRYPAPASEAPFAGVKLV